MVLLIVSPHTTNLFCEIFQQKLYSTKRSRDSICFHSVSVPKLIFFPTMCEIFYHKLDISRKTIPEDVAMGAKGQCNWFTILLVFIVAKFDYSI